MMESGVGGKTVETYDYIRDIRFVECNPDFRFCLSVGLLVTRNGFLNAFYYQRVRVFVIG